MSLPEIIELVPPKTPSRATITVPGSKSITNRALLLAAMASGKVTLHGALWSEDTQIMTEALVKLGFHVHVEPEPSQHSNRTIEVIGMNGQIPIGGTSTNPIELYVGNAGTAARFLTAFVCLGKGVYRIYGSDRMHQRPQKGLFDALRQLGYRIDSAPGDKLPAIVYGTGPLSQPRTCTVDITESSQFASALLLCARIGNWSVVVHGENAEESPYVAMTKAVIDQFPWKGGEFAIEPDASSGSYFWAAGVVYNPEVIQGWSPESIKLLETAPHKVFPVTVDAWPFESGWQIDARFPLWLMRMFKPTIFENFATDAIVTVSRKSDLGDSIMTAIAVAPFAPRPVKFTDLGRLRLQECERVQALFTELCKCGATVTESGDTLLVSPGPLHGAEIETYNDHRMAMSFAVLGLKIPGVRIRNPNCVRKTFPDFFAKLAAPPPVGLGIQIKDVSTGNLLTPEQLVAS